MRIAIDLQSCQSGSRLGGIGRYSLELCKAMALVATDHDLFVVLSNLIPETEADVRSALASYVPQDQIRVFNAVANISDFKNNKAKVKAAELIREDFLVSLKPNIVHVTSLIEGFSEDVVTSIGNFYPAERTAVTLYD